MPISWTWLPTTVAVLLGAMVMAGSLKAQLGHVTKGLEELKASFGTHQENMARELKTLGALNADIGYLKGQLELLSTEMVRTRDRLHSQAGELTVLKLFHDQARRRAEQEDDG